MNRASIHRVSRWMAVAFALVAFAPRAENGKVEWPAYGGDPGNQKYVSLDQINKDNVKDVKVLWTADTADHDLMKNNETLARMRPFMFEATPLMVNGILYFCTSYSAVQAVDARTGETLWVHDPKAYEAGRPTNLGFVSRGVSYWTDGQKERIIYATVDAHLISLDAKTGVPDNSFGKEGKVDLTEGLRRPINRRYYAVSSPVAIYKNVGMIGSSIFDGPTRKEMPPGDVRGFDLNTGEELWEFHTIPQQGEFGNETWEEGSWEYTGNTNVWSIMSVDPELGYAYLPIGTPTNDWYGGHRLGNNLFAESIVCLNALTGERVWHFQMVHHGVWDYDPPAAPTLCDIEVNGKKIKAVAQITKQGFCFVFDRVTGEPVWPIEERPVAQSDVPGERLSPTQPFPTKPAPYERQGVSEDELIDFTPELREEAKNIISKYRYGPLFTPPSEQGTIQLPGWAGGANWGGASFDPETQIIYIPSITSPILVKLGQPDASRSEFRYSRQGDMFSSLAGPQGLPLFKPPYGRITAIDLKTGDHLWQIARGEGPTQHPAIKHLNLPPLGTTSRGYPLCTKTLLFVGDEGGGGRSRGFGEEPDLRVYDKKTGELVAKIPIPSHTTGTPMSYMLDGKQYIIVPAGGFASPGTLVALGLP